MTNREYYREQIIDICSKGKRPIVDSGRLASCSRHDCSGCHNWYKSQNFFGTGFSCRAQENFTQWLEEEYEPTIDWSKVPVDTKILVKDKFDSTWTKRHFAFYKNGVVYAWRSGKTSYTVKNTDGAHKWDYVKLYEQETE